MWKASGLYFFFFPDECAEGYFCAGAAKSSVPTDTSVFPDNGICIVGHYCPRGTPAPVDCPQGTLRNQEGQFCY